MAPEISRLPRMLSSRAFTGTCLSLGLLVAALGFVVLADLTQLLFQVPREVTMITFSVRVALMVIGLAAMTCGYLIARRHGHFGRRARRWALGAFIVMFVFGYLNAPYLMFRSDHQGARFVGIEAIRNAPNVPITDDVEVFVVEINGDARAYPLDWIIQPHIAGDEIGGEKVALTYCSLSHLGMAVTPELEGRELDLRVMTQLKNNLVMYDTHTDRPIQQIWARFEDGEERMREWPTRVMSFGAFRRLYPDGLVYHKPAYNPWDRLTRWMMYTVVGYQHAMDAPVFPTIEEFDERLPNKSYVYGMRVGAAKAAFTLDYIKRNGGIVNTEVGGTPIALVYFEEYEYVDAFERVIDGREVVVSEIDPYGVTPHGRLPRAVMASEVFWVIWSTFYPDTSLFT